MRSQRRQHRRGGRPLLAGFCLPIVLLGHAQERRQWTRRECRSSSYKPAWYLHREQSTSKYLHSRTAPVCRLERSSVWHSRTTKFHRTGLACRGDCALHDHGIARRQVQARPADVEWHSWIFSSFERWREWNCLPRVWRLLELSYRWAACSFLIPLYLFPRHLCAFSFPGTIPLSPMPDQPHVET